MKKQKTLEKEEIKVALYTRVSTEDQAKEGFSLDSQMDRLRNYCQAREWEIYKEFVDDGFSGRYTKRPAYQSLMNEIDRWDVLLVLKMDRIHRNSRNFMEMMDVLRNHEKEFVSMTESLDTSTAMGRFVMDIIQRIAQLESEQIGERVYAGMKQKAQTPVERLDPERSPYLGFNTPYGYEYQNSKLIVNEAEAIIVQSIFSKYLTGSSVGDVCKEFNRNNTPTKRDGKWVKETVASILKSPLYCGFVEWDGLLNAGKHEAIIDIKIFNKVQSKIVKRIRRPDLKYTPRLLPEN